MASTYDKVDGTLYKFMHRFADKPANRAVVSAVEAFTARSQGPVKVADVRQVAMQAARDSYNGQHASADQVRARAYWGAAIAAEERPFTIAEDTRAAAKSVHYFASGAISSRVASWLPFLPQGVRHWLGHRASNLVGTLKEVADQIKGTGFNHQDLATDDAGARAALKD